MKRHRPHQHRIRSEAFQNSRGILNDLSGLWYSLPETNKKLWESYASMLKKPMTGLNAFNSLNIPLTRYLGNDYQIMSPPSTPSTPSFPQLSFVCARSGNSFRISWLLPFLASSFIICQYSCMPGLNDSSTKNWQHGFFVESSTYFFDISIPFPSDSVVNFRIRSMDLFGRLSPWTHFSNYCENLTALSFLRDMGSFPGEDHTYSLACLGNGICLAGTYPNGKIFRSTNYGGSWSDLGQQGSLDWVYPMIYLENGICLAAGDYPVTMYRSVDYGETWSLLEQSFGNTNMWSAVYLENGICLAGLSETGEIFRSTDYGENWSNLGQQGGESSIRSLAYLSDGICLAGTDSHGKILRSTDYGENWSDLGQQFAQTGIRSLICLGHGICLAGTNPGGKILRSDDYGLTWSDLDRQFDETNIRSLVNALDGIAFAGTGPNGFILKSSDYGLTWTKLIQDVGLTQIWSLAYLSNQTVLGCGEPFSNIIRCALNPCRLMLNSYGSGCYGTAFYMPPSIRFSPGAYGSTSYGWSYYNAPLERGGIAISDLSAGAHANNVRTAFLLGYGDGISEEDIDFVYGAAQDSSDWAVENDISLFIRSTIGLENYIPIADSTYPTLLWIMPAGSNSHYQIFISDGNLPRTVSVGAGDTENETAWDVEFFDNDPISAEPTDASSYSNGYIAGKLCKIRDSLGCSFWEARYRARITASNSGIWNAVDGYGIINVSAAIAYSGSIPSDPYL